MFCKELRTTTTAKDVLIHWMILWNNGTNRTNYMCRWRHGDDWQARGRRAKNQRCRPPCRCRPPPRAVSTHCVLHRDALAAKDIEPGLLDVMNTAVTIVYFVKTRATNSRLFTALCEEVGADHHSLFMHTEVRWLSHGWMLTRLFSLR